MDIAGFIKWCVLLNLLAAFVGLAKIQNEEEGGDLYSFLALMLLSATVGIPLFLILWASDIIGLIESFKRK